MKVINKAGKLTKFGRDIAAKIISESDVYGYMFRFHGIHYNGRGRFTTVSESDKDGCKDLLDFLHVEYIEGNDAPRGGKHGHYFQFWRWDYCQALFKFFGA